MDLTSDYTGAAGVLETRGCDLLVTELELPERPGVPLVPGERRGLSLGRTAERLGIPAVYLAPSARALSDELDDAAMVRGIVLGKPGWDEQLLRECQALLGLTSPGSPGHAAHRAGIANLVLDLTGRQWSYLLVGIGFQFNISGTLQIDEKVMNELKCLSLGIGDLGDTWEAQLKAVGDRLREQIFRNNPLFFERFTRLITLAATDSQPNIKIEFVVEESIHGVALEAMLDFSENQYWMLRAPVYRRFSKHEHPTCLFPAPGTAESLHCLIIEAGPPKKQQVSLPGGPLPLSRLPGVAKEAAWLKAYLESHREAFHLGRIEHWKAPQEPRTFLETLETITPEGGWDIVHYCGHSYCHPSIGAYVFLPGKPFVPVKIAVFSLILKHPRLIYLSSCHSSDALFVFKMAEENVGAVLGFRWNIDDQMAFEHAKVFYDELFKERSVEYAFFKARRMMHAREPNNKTWAAPILMM